MFNFTKALSGLLILGTLLFSACNSSDTDSATPSDRVSIGLHQSARIGTDVTVRADSIQDSRCPQDANCVWAGQANVKLVLSKDKDSTTVRLTLGPDIKEGYAKRLDSTNVTLNSAAYKVILREVTPYPTTSNTDQPKTAVVQVTKL